MTDRSFGRGLARRTSVQDSCSLFTPTTRFDAPKPSAGAGSKQMSRKKVDQLLSWRYSNNARIPPLNDSRNHANMMKTAPLGGFYKKNSLESEDASPVESQFRSSESNRCFSPEHAKKWFSNKGLLTTVEMIPEEKPRNSNLVTATKRRHGRNSTNDDNYRSFLDTVSLELQD